MNSDATTRVGGLRTISLLTLVVGALTAVLQVIHLVDLNLYLSVTAGIVRGFAFFALSLLLLLEVVILLGALSLRIFGDARRSLRLHLAATVAAVVALGVSWLLQDASDVAHVTWLGDHSRASRPANNKMQQTSHG